MATYSQTSAPINAKSGNTDYTVWALIALIVVIVCAGAGWSIARQDVPSRDDLARTAALASQTGQANGQSSGYSEGARLGRREAALRARTTIATERRQAAREGYAAGYVQGRLKAGDPDAYLSAGASTTSGTYPTAGYEDVLAAGLFGGDAPGYASSAYDSLGYGATASTPYLGSSASTTATAPGDELY